MASGVVDGRDLGEELPEAARGTHLGDEAQLAVPGVALRPAAR